MEKRILELNRTLYDVTETYPELIPIFGDMGLKGAVNPVLRNTVGRKVTISEGIRLQNLSLSQLVERLEKEGFSVKT